MQTFLGILLILVQLFTYLLLARIVIEMIQSFSRSWQPGRAFSVVGEIIFTITDPPVKLLRRVIPPMPMGGVQLDVSVLVLFFILMILRAVLAGFAF
ncbi:YggT family protein [Corynebacterium xerosis]|uniref:YggT family protein n=1 Tax=Corynebacterium xerosis TaxID=1725 RepID=A0A0M2XKA1_9CORY|nr:YggT family protein [Corynebacterium xerosis]SQB96695.1 YGGT family [Clostridium paraputrificum]AYJ32157.1 YggT family protein [Corynebacterium xerosis]KKO81941.1 membrane protein [Corynebacterium xerosis]PMC61423.1 YggT family protein [Corynebacterium xerosis]QGS33678.1 YggT family protein [Corynebacterium xerosis]